MKQQTQDIMKQRLIVVYLLLGLGAANVAWGQEQTHTAGQSIVLTPNQWATFSPDTAIIIPQYSNGFPVYVASATLSNGNDYLITHQLNASGSINVPMGTGLLMKLIAEGTDSIWFDFSTTGTSPKELEQNVLFGTIAPTPMNQLSRSSGGDRILALRSGTSTFCVVDETQVTEFPAYKAYFTATVVNNAPSFRLVTEEEVATGIEPVEPFESLEPTKFWRNGQLFIRRDGILYDAMGRVVTY